MEPPDLSLPWLDVFSTVCQFAFMLWPLVVAIPLQGRPPYLTTMLVAWGLMGVCRITLFFLPPSLLSSLTIIPEPLNTWLFIGLGAVLWTIAVARGTFKRRKLRELADSAEEASDMLRLSPGVFEEIAAELFNLAGHRAKRTGGSGDHGVDVAVQARNGERWVVQCKRWRGPVGERALRELLGTMVHEKADKGLIITTGEFTSAARKWAKGKPIVLCDGELFLEWWKRAKEYGESA